MGASAAFSGDFLSRGVVASRGVMRGSTDARPRKRYTRTRRLRCGVIGLLVCTTVALASRAGAQGDVNVIQGITFTSSGVEITLFSSRGFPVRDQKEILLIGGHEFLRD